MSFSNTRFFCVPMAMMNPTVAESRQAHIPPEADLKLGIKVTCPPRSKTATNRAASSPFAVRTACEVIYFFTTHMTFSPSLTFHSPFLTQELPPKSVLRTVHPQKVPPSVSRRNAAQFSFGHS
jgi:hypothetical protein